MKYHLTYHAMERLQERFSHMCAYYPEMKKWSREKRLNNIKSCFDDMLSYCEENKSYINNTAYMIKLHEKYGYSSEYKFLELKQENLLFLMIRKGERECFSLVTVMPTDYRPLSKNTKYKQHQKKEDKQQEKITSWANENKHIIDASSKNYLQDLEHANKMQDLKSHMTQELFFKLKKASEDQSAIFLKKISNTRTLFSCDYNDMRYEYICGKNNSGKAIVELTNVSQLPKKTPKF